MTVGEIIRYCQERHIRLTPTDKGTLKIHAPKEVWSEELFISLKTHKSELIKILTVMDLFNGVIASDYTETDYKPILCPYNNQARYIHPEVCKWHRAENDPECERCGCKNAKRVH